MPGQARTEGLLEYPLIVPALNARTSRQRLQPGELSLATGLDGRYTGAGEKFPGFTELKNLGITAVWMQYLTIQKYNSSYVLRGFLVLQLRTGTEYELMFHYLDEADSTWYATTTNTLWAGLTAASEVTAVGNGRFVYIAVKGAAPKVFYHGAGGLTSATMGCGAAYVDPTAPTGGTANTGGSLSPGVYQIGYRYYNSARMLFSGLATATVIITDTAAVNKLTIAKGGTQTPATDGWTHVYLYRSMSVEIAGSVFEAAALYLEKTITCTNGWGPENLGVMNDIALAYQDAYDPWKDDVGLPPAAGVLTVFEGVTFAGSDTTTGSAVTQMQFSGLHQYLPETFAFENTYRWGAEDGPVRAFTKPGDLLYAWTQNAAFRVAKMGYQVVMSRLHGGRGVAGRGGVTSMGKDMLVMTESGLMLVDSMQGNMQAVGAVERILYDDAQWRGTLSAAVIRHDAAMGVTFVVNPTTEEAVLLWQNTGAITMLEDCNFVWGTEGPLPAQGATGPSRAFWLTSTGRILYAADTTPKYTMFGLDAATVTLNGTVASSAAADKVTATGPAGWTAANLKGAYLYLWSGADMGAEPQKRVISSVTTPTITVASAFSPAPAEDDVFCIMPVPWKVRFWPVRGFDVDMPDMGRKSVSSMGVLALDFEGPTTGANPTAYWRVGMCRNLEDTPDAGTVSAIPMTADTSKWQRWSGCSLDGAVLEPYFEHVSAGTNFKLLAVAVNANTHTNRRTG